jgi:hypothetical protein
MDHKKKLEVVGFVEKTDSEQALKPSPLSHILF